MAAVTINQNIQGGTPCFTGTRVPVASLFDHLEAGYTVDYFLSQFPRVNRGQVNEVLEIAKRQTNEPNAVVSPAVGETR